jgi:CRISPR-associated protein Cas6
MKSMMAPTLGTDVSSLPPEGAVLGLGRPGAAAAPTLDTGLIDALFPLRASQLRRDHTLALAQALDGIWPWLQSESGAGVHPLKLVSGTDDTALLSARARLVVRLPRQRLAALAGMAATTLDIQGHTLGLSAPHGRELVPHSTVYAYRVAAQSADEVAFMAEINAELARLGIMGQRVCGKHQLLALGERALDTFSLMLHDLTPEQSLRVQELGLGPHRLWGCGLFVPHKSAAAV